MFPRDFLQTLGVTLEKMNFLKTLVPHLQSKGIRSPIGVLGEWTDYWLRDC